MQTVLVIGAGRSSSWLFKYLFEKAPVFSWNIIVADVSLSLARERAGNHSCATAIEFDMHDDVLREKWISSADLIISMLPAHLHVPVARDCVRLGKHMVTASYVSYEMQELDEEARKKGIILLNECGLDPGIDHMSAMEIIDDIRNSGAELISFKSYTGGLIAPESDDNPWGYKFSWNPRNVILAGQGTARYRSNSKDKYIPYNRLFASAETVEVDGYGKFQGYANRDSLSYRKIYGLEDLPTLLRGTLRKDGYCQSWNILVNLGMTDDSFKIDHSASLSYADLTDSFLPPDEKGRSLNERLADFAGLTPEDPAIQRIVWTGLLTDRKVPEKDISPARALQLLLEDKWKLKEHDKDMIVMQHQFIYIKNGKTWQRNSSLVSTGQDSNYTAMARTVGLPVAIASKLILTGKVKSSGVLLPVVKEWYQPVLGELKEFGIEFREMTKELNAG